MTTSFVHGFQSASKYAQDALALRWVIAGCTVLLAAGCATSPVPRGSRYVVSAPTAEFYKNGPAQDFTFAQHTFDNYLTQQKVGPDFQLPKGAQVTMLKREFGYSRVVTDSGVAGYISNDQMRPAPAMVVAAPAAVPSERNFRDRVRSNPHPRKIEEPHLDMSDLPLPLPG